MVGHVYKCSQYNKSHAYLSLVRQYASSIWDPYYEIHDSTTEKVQRRAARWTLRNYDYHSSVTPMFTLAHFAILLERASYSYIDYYCFTNLYTTYNTTSLHS